MSKFIRWCGRDRDVARLTPQDAADYGEMLAASGTSQQDTSERTQILKDFLTFCYKSNLTTTSLAKHVKARKTGKRATNQERTRPVPVDISSEGRQRLMEELEALQGERVTVAGEIRLAMADKDFRENAPLDAARERQGHLEARIRELEAALNNARIVDTGASEASNQKDQQVKLGSRIRLLDTRTGLESAYTLVNPSEANPIENRISRASPVGMALMNRRTGEEVVVATPRGALRYRIQYIE
ncbi:MAG: GreA/GreB family elongation factor [Chloroflexi bacterium]|nr:GreA/GreB family elongation factor [Chloroflexota bacterium]